MARLSGDIIRNESNALAQLLARERPDEAAVEAQFEKVLAAENELKRVRLKMSLRTRTVLTAAMCAGVPSCRSTNAAVCFACVWTNAS